jgi:poly(A) polymerase
LGSESKDFDFALPQNPEYFVKKVASLLSAPFFPLQREKVFRVVHKDMTLDFLKIEKGLHKDLLRRDFTMNAMAIRIGDGAFFDPFGGVQDIEERKIRLVRTQNLKEDPLRMIRAVRFCASLHFSLDAECIHSIKECAPLIKKSAPERVTLELFYILEQQGSARYLYWLDELNIFLHLFPYSLQLRELRQEDYHHLDVWTHSLATVEYLEGMMERINTFFPSRGQKFKRYMREQIGSTKKGVILKLACILHDFGKGKTMSVKDGRARFIGHERVDIKEFLPSLILGRKEEELLRKLVLFHMRPGNLAKAGITQRGVVRLYRDIGKDFVGLLLLSLADRLAAQGECVDKDFLKKFSESMNKLFAELVECTKKGRRRILSGDDLIKHFRLSPSPIFGKILRRVEEERLSGRIKRKKEALEFVRTLLEKEEIADNL